MNDMKSIAKGFGILALVVWLIVMQIGWIGLFFSVFICVCGALTMTLICRAIMSDE